jgi:hypothetical protein
MGMELPGESHEYRSERDRLLVQEIGLRRAMETVAAAIGRSCKSGTDGMSLVLIANWLSFW